MKLRIDETTRIHGQIREIVAKLPLHGEVQVQPRADDAEHDGDDDQTDNAELQQRLALAPGGLVRLAGGRAAAVSRRIHRCFRIRITQTIAGSDSASRP